MDRADVRGVHAAVEAAGATAPGVVVLGALGQVRVVRIRTERAAHPRGLVRATTRRIARIGAGRIPVRIRGREASFHHPGELRARLLACLRDAGKALRVRSEWREGAFAVTGQVVRSGDGIVTLGTRLAAALAGFPSVVLALALVLVATA